VETRTDSWTDFTRAVAEAFKAGESVTIQTGADPGGTYVAVMEESTEGEEGPWETRG
jgi:hypothetical protein